jgi:hypothetical protein
MWIRLPNRHFYTMLIVINILNQIEYMCDVKNNQLQFETPNFKSFLNLDDYLMRSKPIKQKV